MDSSFKNDQLRQLNLRIGYPEEPLRDEYEKETIFEYLYEINKELHSYHEILASINTQLKEIKNWQENISAKLTNIYNLEDDINANTLNAVTQIANIVTQLTVNDGLSLGGYRVADVMCNIYDILENTHINDSIRIDLRYVDGEVIRYLRNSDGGLYGNHSIANYNQNL